MTSTNGLPLARPYVYRGTSTPPGPCGTVAGYSRHMRARQKPCDACRNAKNTYMRDYKAMRQFRRKEDTPEATAERRKVLFRETKPRRSA